MGDETAALARSITWANSKQTYYTARLLVDQDLVSDFCRAYAYFRWADDVIDITAQSDQERVLFVKRQKELIDRLYEHGKADGLTSEEQIIADLISHDREENGGLQSFIRNMLAIIAFDAHRRGRLINQQELTWYSTCLGKSVTDGIQYFIGNGHPYPDTESRYLAAMAAHIVHLLRDMLADIADGFINIPREYLQEHGIGLDDVDSPPFRAWVRERVKLAQQYFQEGKRYLDQLDVLRCKIAGHWYCARFEGVLHTIESDGYRLRASYEERRKPSSWFRFAWLGIAITSRHIARSGIVTQ